jgi:hypothetical protein
VQFKPLHIGLLNFVNELTQNTASVSVCTEPLVPAGSQSLCGREILFYFRDEASASPWKCGRTFMPILTG